MARKRPENPKFHCLECGFGADGSNSLSAHITKNHGSVQEYHDKHFGPGKCKQCGGPTTFRKSHYMDFCGSKCSAKYVWDRSPERKEVQATTMKGNDFSVGRPKGSVNKNPYPFKEAFAKRMKTMNRNKKNGRIFSFYDFARMDRNLSKIFSLSECSTEVLSVMAGEQHG